MKNINNAWLIEVSKTLDRTVSDTLNACIDYMRHRSNVAQDTIDLEYFLPGNEVKCLHCGEQAFSSGNMCWCPACGKSFTL